MALTSPAWCDLSPWAPEASAYLPPSLPCPLAANTTGQASLHSTRRCRLGPGSLPSLRGEVRALQHL